MILDAAAYRKRLLIRKLWLLDNAVESLSTLYTEAPELNDEVDISDIVPLAFDEWNNQIQKVIAGLESDISLAKAGIEVSNYTKVGQALDDVLSGDVGRIVAEFVSKNKITPDFISHVNKWKSTHRQ